MRLAFSLILAGLLSVAGLSAAPDDDAPPAAPATIEYGDQLLVQIAVRDLDAACAFYGEVMGLKLESRNEPLKWAQFVLPTGARLGVGEAQTVAGSGSVSVNISVQDIDAARRLLEARGVRFAGPTLEIPGVVRLADFSDPDGNRMRLAGAPR